MPCPYCDSDDWEETDSVLDTNVEDFKTVEVTFLCICRDCGRFFKTTEEYESAGDYAYTCEELSDEEIEVYGEGK